jgi:O-antigen/teichoic acid export membrane protein
MHIRKLINPFISQIKGLFSTVLGIATSRDKLQQHLSISLYRNAYYIMAGTIINSVLGFVFWIIAARLYSAEAVGFGSAIIAALGLIALFSELGLGIGLIRFLPTAGRNGNDMLNTSLTVCGSAAIIIALIFLSGLDIWSPALLPVRQNTTFFICFVVAATVTTLQPLVTYHTFLARRDTRFIVFTNLIYRTLNLALAFLFAFFLNSAFGIVASTGLAVVIALAVAVIWFIPVVQTGYRPYPKISKEVICELGRYSIGNYAGRLMLNMPNLVLPLLVVNTMGAEKNAYFYVAWASIFVLRVIPASIFDSLFAEVTNAAVSLRSNTTKSLKLMLLLALPAVLLIVIIAPEFLLLFGKSYSDNGTVLLRMVALSIIPWGINYLYISIARVRKGVSGVIIVSGVSTGLSVGLSYFLMLKMGLTGVGIGYMAGQSIVAIVVAIYLWRSYHPQSEVTSKREMN